MRARFQEWYAPSADDLKRVWGTGTFIFDSNVLLGLYQYPAAALDEFLKVLEKLKDRLWLPHLVGFEFQRHRERALPQNRTVLQKLIERIEELSRGLDTLGLPEHHPILDLPEFEKRRSLVGDALDSLIEGIRADLEKTPDFSPDMILGCEPIRDRLTSLFDSRVGNPFTENELRDLYKDGADRFSRETPPGYKDRGKDEPDRYADLVIWREILRHCKDKAAAGTKDAVFVTNDRKEDWWLRRGETLLGPRPELMREYLNIVGGQFSMYTPSDFLKTAPKYLALSVSPDAIAEVRRISVASPVVALLRFQRMVVLRTSTRLQALATIYDALASGRLKTAADLRQYIENLSDEFASSYVEAPLFFGLIKEAYGPVAVEDDPSSRLMARTIRLRDSAMTKEAFVRVAHAAWLAQAIYRTRYEGFSDEDLLVALFGDDYPEDGPPTLKHAKSLASLDMDGRRT